jgi:hypothetical protein
MIDVMALNGAKDLLMKMTPAERGLFLLFGYASNQVNVLWKLVIVATNETPEKAYPFPSGMINILYVMGFAARPIARSERKAA